MEFSEQLEVGVGPRHVRVRAPLKNHPYQHPLLSPDGNGASSLIVVHGDRRNRGPERDESGFRLFERESELTNLRPLFDSQWPHPVGPVMIEGEAGTGRTALLGAACKMASEAGWAVLRTRGQVTAHDEPLLGLQSLVSSALHTTGDGADAPSLRRCATAAVSDLAATRGVVIAVDDAEWLDGESLDWIRTVCPWPTTERVRLLLTVSNAKRGPHPLTQIVTEPSAQILQPRPLSPLGVERFAHEYFRTRPGRRFIDACEEVTCGVPLLLRGLFGELESSALAPFDDQADAVRSASSPLVARWVARRLTPLPGAAERLLQVVALAGHPLELDVAAELSELALEDAGQVADVLAEWGILDFGRPLRFRQPFVRTSLYAGIPATAAENDHIKLARALRTRGTANTRIAAHLLAARPQHEEWIAEELAAAGQSALESTELSSARDYLRRALAEQPSVELELTILTDLADCESREGDLVSALGHLKSAATKGQPDRRAIETLTRLAQVATPEICEELGDLLATAEKAVDRQDLDSRVEIAVATALLAPARLEIAATIEFLRALAPDDGQATTSTVRQASALLAILSMGSPTPAPPETMAATVLKALRGVDLMGDPLVSELWARALVALALSGHFVEADALLRRGQSAAAVAGRRRAEATFSLGLGLSLARQGDLAGAEAEIERAMRRAENRPWRLRAEAAAHRAGFLVDAGRYEDAETWLETGLEWQDETVIHRGSQALLEQRGRLQARQGRHFEALRDLYAAGRMAQQLGIDSPASSSWRIEAALSLSHLGQDEDATVLAQENLERARLSGVSWAVGTALRVLARVGDPAKKLDRLEEAAGMLTDGCTEIELAEVLVDLGRVLREREPSRARARDLLRGAADIAFRRRAAPLAARAEQELRLSGALPRRLALSGPDALTAAERRVISLAAEGCSNADIASRLFVAEKTVAGHLSRSFRKLGVTSRQDLARILSD